jgi:aldehyde dehydrogenase (NAD+)
MKTPKSGRSLKFDTKWSYAAAPETPDHIQLKEKYELFINGKFVAPASKKYFDTHNPAT